MAVKSPRQPFDVKREITASVQSGQRAWAHDRSKTVGGSEVFRCHRWCFFKKRMPKRAELPENPDDISWGTAERGNVMETWAVEQLKKTLGQDACRYMGDEQVTLIDDEAPLSSTSDGLIIDQPRDFLKNYGVADLGAELNDIAAEIKTFDPRSGDLKTEARPRNVGQNIVQMGLYQRKTNHKPYWGLLMYFNPGNLQDIRPFAVKYDDAVYKNAQRRATDVYDLTKTAKDFRAEGKFTNQCAHCEFTKVCNETDMAMYTDHIVKLKDIDPQQSKELEGLARSVAAARKRKKEAEREDKEQSEALRTMLAEIGTKKAGNLKTDGWSVSVYPQDGKMNIDKKAMEADGVLEKYQKQGNPFLVMRVQADDDDDSGTEETT